MASNPHHKKRKRVGEVNKLGLSRYIRKDIRRTIRQRCGFGCVICGLAIYTYEHIDPPFADAQSHDPARMTLLCHQCQGKVTRGQLSKETVWEYDRNPAAKRGGYSFESFDIGNKFPTVQMGSARILSEEILVIGDELIIGTKPPEVPGGPFRLTARLYNATGDQVLSIRDNEWQVPWTNWDVEVTGPRITVRNKEDDVALVLRSEPPQKLVVEYLRMVREGAVITCDEVAGFQVALRGEGPFGLADITIDASKAGNYIAYWIPREVLTGGPNAKITSKPPRGRIPIFSY